MTRGDSDHDGRGEFVLCGWQASSVKGAVVRAGVLRRLLGASCRLIGEAKVVEDGAGASCGWQALSVKLAIVRAGVLLRLRGVSCRLIGVAKSVEEGAGAIGAVLSLLRPATAVTVMIGASLSQQLD